MTVGIAPTVFAFAGGGAVYNTMTNKSNPAYWVDFQKHETKKDALAHLNRLKKEGRLNKDTDVEIRNDFIAFDEVLGGRVARNNVPKLKPLFDRVSDMFDKVFFITQSDLVKEWSDNVVTVVKEGNISKVKIS